MYGGRLIINWRRSARFLQSCILDGNEIEAWTHFNRILNCSEEEDARASIWDWYVMIVAVSRDPALATYEVFKFACWGSDYESSLIYQSLSDKGEIGGIVGQQQVIAFALMYGFHLRMSSVDVDVVVEDETMEDEKEKACKGILTVWDTFMHDHSVPTSRLVNRVCVALIHLDRNKEAIEELVKWFQPQDSRRKTAARVNAVRMNQYTPGELMHAYLLKELPLSAYGVYTICTGSLYQVLVDSTILTSLLKNAKCAHHRYLLCDLAGSSKELGYDKTDLQHLEKQMTWDRVPAALQAARIFRSYLFDKFPALAKITSPLYNQKVHDGVDKDGADDAASARTLNHIDLQKGSPTLDQATAEEERRGRFEEERKTTTMTPDESVIDAEAFDAYLQVLPFVHDYEKLTRDHYLLVLAWMKALDVKPNSYTLYKVIWAAESLATPSDEVFRSTSASKSLHLSLVEWIGQENIPSDREVYAYINSERRKYLIFD
ncbi:hypothetical protein CBS101457_003518 [Exobasidium rhododendri]|nr:hypothetical protein CBS101457_003518 [Exobasidium rhododendri]